MDHLPLRNAIDIPTAGLDDGDNDSAALGDSSCAGNRWLLPGITGFPTVAVERDMGFQVVNSAVLECSFGTSPGMLAVVGADRELAENQPAGNVLDYIPLVNILPFGMCTSLANPSVAAATSAALGVLTPVPCIPAVPSPWFPGVATVLINGAPALNEACTCQCLWAGVITVKVPGQSTVAVP